MTRAYRTVHKFGRNPSVSTNTAPEDVWAAGGLMVWPTQASTLTIVSDSANDSAAGSGAQQIRVEGLDENFDEIYELVELNGLTSVATLHTFFRVDRAYVTRVGTYHRS